MPGMRTSLRITPGNASGSCARHASARLNTCTVKPDNVSHCSTASRMGASSSTTITELSMPLSLLSLAEAKEKPCASADIFGAEAAAQLMDDGERDREPQPQSVAHRFGGEKR